MKQTWIRLIALVCCFALAAVMLVACGDKEQKPEETQAPATSTEEENHETTAPEATQEYIPLEGVVDGRPNGNNTYIK